MTAENIADRAWKKQPLPDGTTLAEQEFYFVMRQIYYLYSIGQISADEGRHRKTEAIKAFNRECFDNRLHSETARRASEIEKLFRGVPKENHCPVCNKAFQIFSGLIHSADDLLPSEYERKKGEQDE